MQFNEYSRKPKGILENPHDLQVYFSAARGKFYNQNGAIPMDQVENSGQYFLSIRFIGEYFA